MIYLSQFWLWGLQPSGFNQVNFTPPTSGDTTWHALFLSSGSHSLITGFVLSLPTPEFHSTKSYIRCLCFCQNSNVCSCCPFFSHTCLDCLFLFLFLLYELKQLFKDSLHKLHQKQHLQQHPLQNTQQLHPTLQLSTITNHSPDNTHFLHLQYHPKGISRHTIQQTYTQQCTTMNATNKSGLDNMLNENTGGILNIKKLTLAYHR